VLVDVAADGRNDGVGLAEAVAVEFEAEMRQVKSMADGTYNIVLNVPEYCLPQVQTMMGWLKSLVKIVMANEDKQSN
jgi:hypothetical protein